jgi:SAM-dependent methyltransferase
LRALPPARESYFRQFISQYETVRAQEGRGSLESEYYLSLPFKDLTGNNAWQWQIRSHTFQHLIDKVLVPLEQTYARELDVLDIGAGNCWLSYRLARRGHRPVAVDLLDNDSDGLGSARHYFSQLGQPFICAQTEMDRLPFAPAQFDLVIFNAAFHYSVDYSETLAEALRCLRRPGYVVIADSPFYFSEASGQQMVEEKRTQFSDKFGFRSDSIASREYLTKEALDQLATRFHLQWRTEKPWYGLNWALRPLKAMILRKREPSKFYIFWSEVRDAHEDAWGSNNRHTRDEVHTA